MITWRDDDVAALIEGCGQIYWEALSCACCFLLFELGILTQPGAPTPGNFISTTIIDLLPLTTTLVEHRFLMALSGFGLRVLAEPVGMQTALLEMASRNLAATAATAVQTLTSDGFENLGLGRHGLVLRRAGATLTFQPSFKC